MRKNAWEKSPQKKDDLKSRGFYTSKVWRRTRLQALQRDHYLCQNCLRQHRIKKATEVHHIVPVDVCPDRALDVSNLESLCWDCHELTKHRGQRPAETRGVRILLMGGSDDPGVG